PETGKVLRTIQSTRFVTGVTWVEGELWHGTWEGDESDLRRIDPRTGEVLEKIEMPRGVAVSGLESNGSDQFFCGGGNSGKRRAVSRPTRGSRAARGLDPFGQAFALRLCEVIEPGRLLLALYWDAVKVVGVFNFGLSNDKRNNWKRQRRRGGSVHQGRRDALDVALIGLEMLLRHFDVRRKERFRRSVFGLLQGKSRKARQIGGGNGDILRISLQHVSVLVEQSRVWR